MPYTPNYPDVLGYITGGVCQNIGVIQTAVAVRPFAVRAGKPFEVVILLQNTSDAPTEVVIKLNLPEVDQKGKRDRFITKRTSIAVDLQPAEVGYVVLPVASLPDTAIGSGYSVAVEFSQTPKGNPNRVRKTEGGSALTLEEVRDPAREQINSLKGLRFFAVGNRTLRGHTLETPFNVIPGGLGQPPELKPRWANLWSMQDYFDPRMVIEKYRQRLAEQLLPKLNRQTCYPHLLAATQKRFAASGYTLSASEAQMIAYFLTLLLEYAEAEVTAQNSIAAAHFYLSPILKHDLLPDTLTLPHWFNGFLKLLSNEPAILSAPEKIITDLLYPDLLRDAIGRGFTMVENATGLHFGSAEELAAYGDQVLTLFQDNPADLTYAHVYLPLVLGGVIAHEGILLAGEKPHPLLFDVSMRFQAVKRTHYDEDSAPFFDATDKVLRRALSKYSGIIKQ
ncbi:MAG: hypothetical protein ACOYL5_09820 [Phototrophicaceae bacterium]|jgi:hypothetical protein